MSCWWCALMGRFAPWLFTIARRSVTDRLRGEYAQAEKTSGFGDMVVEDPAEAMVDRAALVSVLSALPVEECADICQIPAGTVKSRLNRARRLLREHLEEKGHRP